jgi:Tax1-binding protein 3
MIHPDGPAARTNLKVNDKILQVNGWDFTMITHKKAVEFLRKGKILHMLVYRVDN